MLTKEIIPVFLLVTIARTFLEMAIYIFTLIICIGDIVVGPI